MAAWADVVMGRHDEHASCSLLGPRWYEELNHRFRLKHSGVAVGSAIHVILAEGLDGLGMSDLDAIAAGEFDQIHAEWIALCQVLNPTVEQLGSHGAASTPV